MNICSPKPLDLSSTNELLLMDHIDVFHKNGFEFVIDKEAEPTKRVLLKTQPVSKNWSFGKDGEYCCCEIIVSNEITVLPPISPYLTDP